MNEVFLRVDERGRHVPYRVVNGIYRLDIGPAFISPRDAITYAIELEGMPSVSPLRPASRSGQNDLAGAGALSSRDDSARSEAPNDTPRSVSPSRRGVQSATG